MGNFSNQQWAGGGAWSLGCTWYARAEVRHVSLDHTQGANVSCVYERAWIDGEKGGLRGRYHDQRHWADSCGRDLEADDI